MKIFEDLNLLQRLNLLIRTKATGSPCELGEKLDLSERQTRRIIEEMKDTGLPIEYNKQERSYCYTKSVLMKFEIFVVEGDEKKKILGGEKKDFNFFKDFFQTDIFRPNDPAPL